MKMDRRRFFSAITSASAVALAGCNLNSSEDEIPDEFESIRLEETIQGGDEREWVLSVELASDVDAHTIVFTKVGWGEKARKVISPGQSNIEFRVAGYSQDEYWTYGAQDLRFELRNDDGFVAEATVNFKTKFSVSDPEFIDQVYVGNDRDFPDSTFSTPNSAFSFKVTNDGEFPVQIAYAGMKDGVAIEAPTKGDGWPSMVMYEDEGEYDVSFSDFGPEVHPSFVIGPGESTRVGALGGNAAVEEGLDRLCDGSSRTAEFRIAVKSEFHITGKIDYSLSGPFSGYSCSEGTIDGMRDTNFY